MAVDESSVNCYVEATKHERGQGMCGPNVN